MGALWRSPSPLYTNIAKNVTAGWCGLPGDGRSHVRCCGGRYRRVAQGTRRRLSRGECAGDSPCGKPPARSESNASQVRPHSAPPAVFLAPATMTAANSPSSPCLSRSMSWLDGSRSRRHDPILRSCGCRCSSPIDCRLDKRPQGRYRRRHSRSASAGRQRQQPGGRVVEGLAGPVPLGARAPVSCVLHHGRFPPCAYPACSATMSATRSAILPPYSVKPPQFASTESADAGSRFDMSFAVPAEASKW